VADVFVLVGLGADSGAYFVGRKFGKENLLQQLAQINRLKDCMVVLQQQL
jgi:CDP-diglyceride synthetase